MAPHTLPWCPVFCSLAHLPFSPPHSLHSFTFSPGPHSWAISLPLCFSCPIPEPGTPLIFPCAVREREDTGGALLYPGAWAVSCWSFLLTETRRAGSLQPESFSLLPTSTSPRMETGIGVLGKYRNRCLHSHSCQKPLPSVDIVSLEI